MAPVLVVVVVIGLHDGMVVVLGIVALPVRLESSPQDGEVRRKVLPLVSAVVVRELLLVVVVAVRTALLIESFLADSQRSPALLVDGRNDIGGSAGGGGGGGEATEKVVSLGLGGLANGLNL